MPISIGVAVTEHLAMGVVEGHRVAGAIPIPASDESIADGLSGMPADGLVNLVADAVERLAANGTLEAVGLAFPGLVRSGVIEEAPNLPQFKGCQMEALLRSALAAKGLEPKITISNDADAIATGIAAMHGQLDRLVRVWMLGNGVGYGCYPPVEGVWEGGHMVVTLDPNEKFCGCGGRGHMEGIVGRRAMRLRFLDMEPEEVFAAAKGGEDPRCTEFVLLWHRALAAATASSIHMHGPGKFYLSGANAGFVNVPLLNRYMQEMIMMSSLQGYVFEVIEHSDEAAIIGAAVNALP